MTAFRLTVRDNMGRLVEEIESAVLRISDYRPMWETLRRPWEKSRVQMYRTQGRATGANWKGYEQTGERAWYVWEKAGILGIDIKDPADLNYLILDWERRRILRPSLTNTRHTLAVWKPEPRALTMGTKVRYAGAHEYGIGRAPADLGGHAIVKRSLLQLGRPFVRDVARQVGVFAATGLPSGRRAGINSAGLFARLAGGGRA